MNFYKVNIDNGEISMETSSHIIFVNEEEALRESLKIKKMQADFVRVELNGLEYKIKSIENKINKKLKEDYTYLCSKAAIVSLTESEVKRLKEIKEMMEGNKL